MSCESSWVAKMVAADGGGGVAGKGGCYGGGRWLYGASRCKVVVGCGVMNVKVRKLGREL